MSGRFDEVALNLNLILPFKDNIGSKQRLHQRRMDDFKEELEDRVEELRTSLKVLFGQEFELAIMSRGDGYSKKYYWRFSTSKRDRKYSRLVDKVITEYVQKLHDSLRLKLKEIEEELIYINANIKVLKAMEDSILQSKKELGSLRELKFQNEG